MRIEFVAAMSENRVIGKRGALPWHLPNDLRHFKKITSGSPILMGRKTFSSIGKALPKRKNLVLTRDKDFSARDVTVYHHKNDVLNSGLDKIFVIGGQDIFELFLEQCSAIHLTVVHAVIDGDRFFPEFFGFIEKSKIHYLPDSEHALAYSFIEYYRPKPLVV